jgi:hypothetical protein
MPGAGAAAGAAATGAAAMYLAKENRKRMEAQPEVAVKKAAAWEECVEKKRGGCQRIRKQTKCGRPFDPSRTASEAFRAGACSLQSQDDRQQPVPEAAAGRARQGTQKRAPFLSSHFESVPSPHPSPSPFPLLPPPVRRDDIDADSRKLRARKLAALAQKDLTAENLRSLFRLLDDDGSHEVSPAEIQRGLLLLGFENAADPVALSRLLVDIDDDKTGTITESEFMSFFATQTRQTLKEKLDSYVIDRAFITATFYGTSGGRPTIRTETVAPSRLADWLNSLPPNRGRLWLDVVGYDEDAHAILAQALGMEVDDICAALLFQHPKLAIVDGPLGPRANLILHTMSISTSPLADKRRSIIECCPSPIARCLAAIFGVELAEEGNLLDVKKLIPKEQITESPPAISLEQAAVIVVDDRTIVTLRAPAFDGEEDNTKYKSAAVVPVDDALANDNSVIRAAYDDVRSQMAANAASVTHLFGSSVKGLAVVLVVRSRGEEEEGEEGSRKRRPPS